MSVCSVGEVKDTRNTVRRSVNTLGTTKVVILLAHRVTVAVLCMTIIIHSLLYGITLDAEIIVYVRNAKVKACTNTINNF